MNTKFVDLTGRQFGRLKVIERGESGPRNRIMFQGERQNSSVMTQDKRGRISPLGSVLDRIDNNKNYEPENCRWSNKTTSSQNRKTVRNYTFLGQTCCIAEWARRSGLSLWVLHRRLARGWPIDKALTEHVVALEKIPTFYQA